MLVEEVKLLDYRNYKQLQLQFHPKLNIFVGENAQGKTNILEALYVCAIGKSFRTNKDQEMVRMLKEHAYIKTSILKSTDKVEIEVLINRENNKRIKVNKLSLTKYGDLLGNLNVVLFSPEDLKIIKEGPNERRRFINNDISQILPRYYYTLVQYNKILQQRNKVLKNYKGKTIDLEVWDEQLIDHGAWLMIYRRNFIKRIAILAKLMHKKITDGLEILEVQYDSSIKIKEENEIKDIKEKFREALKEAQPLEERRGLTLIGPHRDDLIFKVNGLEIKKYGSQGQQRTAVLSLKLAELELMKGEVGEYPILLLDDVMSELDKKRQNYLIKNLKNVQTFITTTMIEPLNINNQEEYKLFHVYDGEIHRFSAK
ncbi:DNA replication/repair protein RecF [Clostridium formicaceticum]|uniref:DNA replication and repair protein RecF n=1 Tax=Clostridium formicaceticum TaxID=1497 RepID=A0AAC9RHR6_9CLOT|nr:DNA replication/repair protein RecF [Clostridium formicaceticum]AOY75419.1 DNA replication protein RecF [Clostridium formicaceticum]ARE85697.1 DNA replication and repair protein RecF [Clostridium formicaceticum]